MFTPSILKELIDKNNNNVNKYHFDEIYNVILKVFKLKIIYLQCIEVENKIQIMPVSLNADDCKYYVFMLFCNDNNKFSLITFDYNNSKTDSIGTRIAEVEAQPVKEETEEIDLSGGGKYKCSYSGIFENPKNIKTQDEYFKRIEAFEPMIPPIYIIFLIYASLFQTFTSEYIKTIGTQNPYISIINPIINLIVITVNSFSNVGNKRGLASLQNFQKSMQSIFNVNVPIKQESNSKKKLTFGQDLVSEPELGPESEEESGNESERKSNRTRKQAEIKGNVVAKQQSILKKGRKGKKGGGQTGGAGENFYSSPQINFGASSLSYYATIYLELEKGTVLTTSKLANSSCATNSIGIQFKFAKFLGQEPVIKPDLNKLPDSILNSIQNNSNNTMTNRNSNNSNNSNNRNSIGNTRKINNSRRGGKPSNKNNKTKKIKKKR